ncbi:adenylate cyclase (plasmid) [Sinorhizobium americanum CCGM7]|uniref:integral membrane protein n=1 Tax=Sinorhizobium americanum TaxID=194963 RepID=UPI0004D4181D|nr:integral membrane protein [Sinorhizobium americanum]APG88096.1 adenylate cyclase [Sinorhizobium americanum CCGM7]
MVQTRSVEVAAPDPTALPTEAELRSQLARILSSPEFDVPERARKFLAYIVEEAIGGRGDRIKGFSIAVEVFGRDSSFDAQADPVVRIEAGRIRRALERYYLVAGPNDPIIITVPKGGYVPAFSRNGPASLPEASGGQPKAVPDEKSTERPPRWKQIALAAFGLVILGLIALYATWGTEQPASTAASSAKAGSTAPGVPRLTVFPFEDLSGTGRSRVIARGLTDKVIEHVSKFKEIVVIAGRSSDSTGETSFSGAVGTGYALSGGLRLDGDKLRLTSRLINREDGSVLWAESYSEDLEVRNLVDLETNVARAVATALAHPYGIIFRSDASKAANVAPDDWEAYQCTLAYYGYRADLNPQSHVSVQGCLKRAVERFPGYATAWALLSLTYIDELRFRYRIKAPSPPPLDLAMEAARRAVELDPQNVRGLQAEMLAFFFRGDVETALSIGARAVEINPSDPELSAEYGLRLALSGEWKQGCGRVVEAVSRNSGPLGYFEASLALCSYMQEDYVVAEQWIRAADVQANPLYHFIAAAILGQLQKSDEAARERRWVEQNALDLLKNIRRELALRIHRPEDQAHFMDGLVKAGLSIP